MRDLHYRVEIRDKNGKHYKRTDGNVVTGIQYPDNGGSDHFIKIICKQTYLNFQAICKEGSIIEITVSYQDGISSTYPVLYTYNGVKEELIKH